MILKVDKEELNNVSDELIKSSTSFSDEIDVWEKAITELKEIWDGDAAQKFYSKIDPYLEKLRMVSTCSNSLGTIIEKTNKEYIQKDEAYADELKKENDELESNDE